MEVMKDSGPMNKTSKIYVAGHRGMVGSAIVRCLKSEDYENLVTRTSTELDLRDQQSVNSFFKQEQPEFVFLAAAKVGGIVANNSFKGQFMYENLMIQSNVIHAAYEHGVKKLLFLGSSCIYPKYAEQPIKEDSLLTGALEPTNEPYALAKIAGLRMCDFYREQYGCDFISLMPTNLYGPGDNYDLQNSHVIPALLRKFHEAKLRQSVQGEGQRELVEGVSELVELWGTGSPMREFLHVDDLADACLYFMQNYSEAGHVNIGTGTDMTIKELAEMIAEIVGYQGDIFWNTSYPDGTPRKLLDVSKASSLGWKATTSLADGLRQVYKEKFLEA
jgi:GDP-L-fucose synthase